jgi:aspartate-semialdehyde dehydrogenase
MKNSSCRSNRYGWRGYVESIKRKFLSDTDELILVASERSVGKEIDFNGKSHSVVGLAAVAMQPDIAFCRW